MALKLHYKTVSLHNVYSSNISFDRCFSLTYNLKQKKLEGKEKGEGERGLGNRKTKYCVVLDTNLKLNLPLMSLFTLLVVHLIPSAEIMIEEQVPSSLMPSYFSGQVL